MKPLLLILSNGGQISPTLYEGYSELKEAYGDPAAKSIVQFRSAHVAALLRIAKEENLLHDSQARNVQDFDVYFNDELFEGAKEGLKEYLRDMPAEIGNFKVYEGRQNIEVRRRRSPSR